MPDATDACPRGVSGWTSSPELDSDGDGCRDADEDNDDDNDSIADDIDLCPQGVVGWVSIQAEDRDRDGCRDADEDDDVDGDGVLNEDDDCAAGFLGWSSNLDTDFDADGCRDLDEDNDDDNDLSPDNLDCEPRNPAAFPGNPEVCDGIDNDCLNGPDDGLTQTWYRDMDMDGFGDPTLFQEACEQPDGYVLDNGDCDDNDMNVNPNSGCVLDRNGDYEGVVTLSAQSFAGSDTCIGMLVGNIQIDRDPQIQGTTSCTFQGQLAFAGVQSAVVEGNIIADPDVEGMANFSGGVDFSGPWTGQFIGPNEFEGFSSGNVEVMGFPVSYTIEFNGVRTP